MLWYFRPLKNQKSNFLIFWPKILLSCKKLKFLKNLFFYSFEILNFQALSEIFEVFLMLEGLNQTFLLRTKVLEFNFMVLLTPKKSKI